MEQTDLSKSKKPAIIAIIIIAVILTISLIMLIINLKSNQKQSPAGQKQELIKTKIPYYSPEFTVVYSQKKDQIYINILKQPYEENRQKALNWLKQNGYDPQTLNIQFTPRNAFK